MPHRPLDIDRALDVAQAQVDRLITAHPGRVPPGTRLLLPPRAHAVALSAVGGDPR